ncbi:uncharacterized protein BX664DRAFT_111721 [Halteromyces radiatus]|uniref:uncharacterized protein n=1 Tax=Halteromyces radiatus TaxID=101107 RepID=UPI00221E9EA1|nr:uncharacterized protein BX664DRAFT_111721 [Halteromyces radiatus]KAI8093645.1 hypothetical protein BX664DRAFT_111721 [Halteromyces radiatus]
MSDEEYEVEAIRAAKRPKGRKKSYQYLIKWKGYDSDENTWEWERNITAPLLLEQFWKENQPSKTKKQKKPRKQPQVVIASSDEDETVEQTSPPDTRPASERRNEKNVIGDPSFTGTRAYFLCHGDLRTIRYEGNIYKVDNGFRAHWDWKKRISSIERAITWRYHGLDEIYFLIRW